MPALNDQVIIAHQQIMNVSHVSHISGKNLQQVHHFADREMKASKKTSGNLPILKPLQNLQKVPQGQQLERPGF